MAPAPQGEDKDKPVEHPDDDHFNRLDPPDVVINADSSESEEDEAFGGYMGYQMLAQDVPDNVESDNEKSDEEREEQEPGQAQSDNIPNLEENVGPPPHVTHHVTHPDFPNTPNLPGYMKVPEMPRPEKGDLLWNQPGHQKLYMDPDHADKIRSAMSGFKLPSSHIPDWARSISETDWKEQVVNRLVDVEQCDSETERLDISSQQQQLMSTSQAEAGTPVCNHDSTLDTRTEQSAGNHSEETTNDK